MIKKVPRSIKTKYLNFFRRFFTNKTSEILLIAVSTSNSIFSKFASKLIPSNYLYAKNSFRETIVNGAKMTLDLSEYVNHFVYFRFEDKGLGELMSLAEGKKTVLDVGANIGYTALSMWKRLEKDGVVYAFEPDSYNFKRLIGNLDLNTDHNVRAVNKGLADEASTLKLVVDTADNLSGNRIKKDAVGDYELIEVITLDEFCRLESISKIDVIKIDVEGYEHHVLRGAEQVLKNSRPDLFIEIDDGNLKDQGTSAKDLIFHIEKYYSHIYNAQSLEVVTSQADFTNCHFDVVAKNEN